MHTRSSLLVAVLLAWAVVAIPMASAQTFGSPFRPDNGYRIPDNETIFSAEWFADTEAWNRFSSPALADINGDGDLEVILGDLNGHLHVLDPHTGAPLPGWPVQVGSPIATSPAVGDVDGDGLVDIVICFGYRDTHTELPQVTPQNQGGIASYRADGSLISVHYPLDRFHNSGALYPDGYAEHFNASPALGDMDGDGVLEIVVGAHDQYIYAINAVGGAADYAADGSFVGFNEGVTGLGRDSIYRRDNDGDGRWDEDPLGDMTPYPNSASTPFPGGDGAPGFAGVDDDGDGLIDEGHPHDDDEDSDRGEGGAGIDLAWVNEDEHEWPFTPADSIWASAALCDLDLDGDLDAIVPADFSGVPGIHTPHAKIHVNDLTGVPHPNWLGDLPGERGRDIPNPVWTPVSCGDVDGDGFQEMFMGTNNWWHPTYTSWAGGFIYGFNHDGAEIRDGDANPATRGIFAVTRAVPLGPDPINKPRVLGAPALGDLDGDGQLEIVAGAYDDYNLGSTHAWNPDGSVLPGFPVSTQIDTTLMGPLWGGPMLADLDGDGDIEIATNTLNAFFTAYHHDGSLVQGTPFWSMDDPNDTLPDQAFHFFQTSPAVGDIDSDGMIEVVISGRNAAGRGRIWVFQGGSYNPLGMEWPMVSANPQRTGIYWDREATRVRGDTNADDIVDVADFVTLVRHLNHTQRLDPSGAGYINALVNGDPFVDHNDLAALLNDLLGL